VLPLDYAVYSKRVGVFIEELGALPGVKEHLDLAPLRAAERKWAQAAASLEPVLARAESDTALARRVNAALRGAEQQWLLANGLPGRPWMKHALYAPKETYAAMKFPGVRGAVDAKDWPLAKAQLALLVQRMDAVTEVLLRVQRRN